MKDTTMDENIPEILARDVHELYDSTYTSPVLYIQVGPDEDGDVTDMSVRLWDEALVPSSERIVLRQSELVDQLPKDSYGFMGGAEKDQAINAILPELQETVTRIATQVIEQA